MLTGLGAPTDKTGKVARLQKMDILVKDFEHIQMHGTMGPVAAVFRTKGATDILIEPFEKADHIVKTDRFRIFGEPVPATRSWGTIDNPGLGKNGKNLGHNRFGHIPVFSDFAAVQLGPFLWMINLGKPANSGNGGLSSFCVWGHANRCVKAGRERPGFGFKSLNSRYEILDLI